MERVCQFNEEVICDSAECYHCGWDPEVARARSKELLRKTTGQKLYKVPFTGYCEVWANSPEEAEERVEDVDSHFTASYDFGKAICLEKEESNELD